VLAVAEAERMRIQAAAAASHDRVALERMLIDQLPQIVKEASAGLAGANVNVLNGADGLSEIAAGLVSQGLTILDSVRKNLNGEDGRGDATGSSAAVALRGIVTGERRGGARNGEGGAGKGGPADGPVDID
jgi:uncharacterized membrane protein YqiK